MQDSPDAPEDRLHSRGRRQNHRRTWAVDLESVGSRMQCLYSCDLVHGTLKHSRLKWACAQNAWKVSHSSTACSVRTCTVETVSRRLGMQAVCCAAVVASVTGPKIFIWWSCTGVARAWWTKESYSHHPQIFQLADAPASRSHSCYGHWSCSNPRQGKTVSSAS